MVLIASNFFEVLCNNFLSKMKEQEIKYCKQWYLRNSKNKTFPLMRWFTVNIAICPLPLTSFLFNENFIFLSKFSQNCLHSVVFHLHKSLNALKISLVEMSFAKIKLVCFNLHPIVAHT